MANEIGFSSTKQFTNRTILIKLLHHPFADGRKLPHQGRRTGAEVDIFGGRFGRSGPATKTKR